MTSLHEIDPQARRLIEIFDPNKLEVSLSAISNETKFVHYTSAATAFSILYNNEIWMRNASMMNDYMEIRYGRDFLFPAFNEKKGIFEEYINSIHGGLYNEFLILFNSWLPTFETDTYITCVSEHNDKIERNLGRLSMWRAYGIPAGVAIVLKNNTFLRVDDRLGAYFSPVTYCTKAEFQADFNSLLDRINDNREFLKSTERQVIANYLFERFKGFLLRTKHPGFYEEREWRLIYIPNIDRSEVIKTEVRLVGHVPQIVSILPFDIRRNPIDGLRVSDLVDYIIIGPSENPLAIKRAFVRLLESNHIDNAQDKVIVSEIPLKT